MEFICSQCPRRCATRRTDEFGEGYCRAPALPRLARAALHHWEEPCISGTRGSGTIFFSGCSLGCVYCQNYALSHGCYGKPSHSNGLPPSCGSLPDRARTTLTSSTPRTTLICSLR